MDKIRIGIVGATGYTGSELSRILLHHPQAELVVMTSESQQGRHIAQAHPFLNGLVDLKLDSMGNIGHYDLDVVFLGLPHGISMDFVQQHHGKRPFKIIDLSGDFRLDHPDTYEAWYKQEHRFPEGMEDAVYGIPELFGEEIKKAALIANPGCFPTGALLGLAPLMQNHLVEDQIIVDAKTGVTGAGIKASEVTHFAHVNDNFRAYGMKHHRHGIEIEDTARLLGGDKVRVQFQPHLLPVDRGILSTIYTRPLDDRLKRDPAQVYARFYAGKPFIRLPDAPPSIKQVRGSNYCDLYSTYDERTGNLITITVIDNLVRGAAGQAVQNMNILFGAPEMEGLRHIPLHP